VLTKQQVLQTLTDNANTLRQYSVLRIGVFGSYLHGNATEVSDIDLFVELKEKSFDNYMDLKFYLEDLFQRKIDLVLEDSLKPRLKPLLAEAEYAAGL